MKTALLVLFCALWPSIAAPQTFFEYLSDDEIPADVKPFVESRTRVLVLKRADLNGDGRMDILLVLEMQPAQAVDPPIEDRQRPLLLLIRQPDGSLTAAKRNDMIVYCSTCGGAMGDPFVTVKAARNSFTIGHYGGSAWRWGNSFTFGFSRRDNTWQLVEVAEESFHALDPKEKTPRVYKPPKDFGKIDIADFDPETWKGAGRK